MLFFFPCIFSSTTSFLYSTFLFKPTFRMLFVGVQSSNTQKEKRGLFLMNQVLYNVQFSHELFKSRPMNHKQHKISFHQHLILIHFSIQRCGLFLCRFLRPIFQARLNRNGPRFLWIYFYPCLYFHAELCDIINETLWPATRKLAPTQRDRHTAHDKHTWLATRSLPTPYIHRMFVWFFCYC